MLTMHGHRNLKLPFNMFLFYDLSEYRGIISMRNFKLQVCDAVTDTCDYVCTYSCGVKWKFCSVFFIARKKIATREQTAVPGLFLLSADCLLCSFNVISCPLPWNSEAHFTNRMIRYLQCAMITIITMKQRVFCAVRLFLAFSDIHTFTRVVGRNCRQEIYRLAILPGSSSPRL